MDIASLPLAGTAYAFPSPERVMLRRVKQVYDPALIATHDKCFGVMKSSMDAWMLPTSSDKQKMMKNTSWIVDPDARQKVTRELMHKMNGTAFDPHQRLKEEALYGRGVQFKHDGTTQLLPSTQRLDGTGRQTLSFSASSPRLGGVPSSPQSRMQLASLASFSASSPRLGASQTSPQPRSPNRRAVTSQSQQRISAPRPETVGCHGYPLVDFDEEPPNAIWQPPWTPSWISQNDFESIVMQSPTAASMATTTSLACQTQRYVLDKQTREKLLTGMSKFGASGPAPTNLWQDL